MNFVTDEMKKLASAFSIKWNGTSYEKGEAQTFTNELFNIFGIDRHSVARFEKQVKRKSKTVFIDTFWPGKLLIEAKSSSKDSEKDWLDTLKQAEDYVNDLTQLSQKPKIILLTNFKRFRKYKVEYKSANFEAKITFEKEVLLQNLKAELEEFDFFPRFIYELEREEAQVNQEATKRIAGVNKAITQKIGKTKDTGIFLARILFCLFSEDTNIFKLKQFETFLRENTNGDNLKEQLNHLFEALNTPVNLRKSGTLAYINEFPYVNGGLFSNNLSSVNNLDNTIREAILFCCAFDWSLISPVIFGALFQSLIIERREMGAHYTSERNILRVIKPLVLDSLYEEFDKVKDDLKQLNKFREKVNQLVFLDPACGCGNFLVVTYKELRLLDIEIIKQINKITKQLSTDVNSLVNIKLDHFYGYEIDQTSCMIAEIAMWLTEHQLNQNLLQFGVSVPTIPLIDSAVIKCCNALEIEWESNSKFSRGIGNSQGFFDYIIGNPPFIGKAYQTKEQKKDINKVLKGVKGAGVLDYVTCWYIKSAQYIKQSPKTRGALVSTNSIAQGEQTGILWNELFKKYNLKIQFAHQTFKWGNDAIEDVDQASVHCIIIGFGNSNLKDKFIYEYDDIHGDPKVIKVKNINPYLIQGSDTVILKRRKPLCNVPHITYGNMPNDGGYLLLKNVEKEKIIKTEPNTAKWIRPLISANEYLNGKKRWCFWLLESQPKERLESTEIFKRISEVRKIREKSTRIVTKKMALTPWLFGEIRQPKSSYLLIPRTTSENRKYIPISIFEKENIANDSCVLIGNANLYHFGVLTSSMHMTWVKFVCGRLKSDYRYSNEIVYNNFPWPINVSKKMQDLIIDAVNNLLQIRSHYFKNGNSLADLYNKDSNMPVDLRKAHNIIDKLVDKCYNDTSFITEFKRLQFLFDQYDTYNSGIFSKNKLL